MQAFKLKLKALARRVLGPALTYRIRRITGVRTEIDTLTRAWHQQVPNIANATASVAAVAREQARMKREYEAAIAELRARIERLEAASPAPPARSPDTQ